ncbi:MAG: hypothetical protein LBV61_01465 [Burkholderiaceae bacterium]|jgi:hypothetical protein|nr:hypothetical protein [Burkholderiaceae bacterium]
MSALPFTDRELKRAWRELSTIATPSAGISRENPHRLLLFYAVECGLKAAWLKQQRRTLFDSDDIEMTGHSLRKILKDLKVGFDLSLPQNLRLNSVNHNKTEIPRNGDFDDLHQVWRYGGKCLTPTDKDCEKRLQKVLNWIHGELK